MQPATIEHRASHVDAGPRWTVDAVATLLSRPFNDLLQRAQQTHRAHHDPNAVQLSTLLSIKTGGCPEDCGYCPQAARYHTGVDNQAMLSLAEVTAAASAAKAAGASRFCMGAAWRGPKDRDLEPVLAMVREVKALGLETCATLGMLTPELRTNVRNQGRAFIAKLEKLKDELGASIILITHDLGVVAGMTQRIHVMYGGKIVEKADTAELFANPKMPYTWGLLRSIPRLDERRKAKLVPIEGLPPDLIAPPPGCRFEPRCQYRRDICKEKEPELEHIPNSKPDHEARCWGTQQGGWLVDTDWHKEVGDTRVIEEIKQEVAQLPPEPKPGDVPPPAAAV